LAHFDQFQEFFVERLNAEFLGFVQLDPGESP
jgi:hypothetical protein